MDTKLCKKHNNGEGAYFPVSSFYKHNQTKDGLMGCCKECSKAATQAWQKTYKDRANARINKWKKEHPEKVYAYNSLWQKLDREKHPEKWLRRWLRSSLRKRFGLTLEEFDRMVTEQNGVCAICGGGPTKYRTRLSVDHDHQTGKVRGLLCSTCNWAIERFQIPGWVDNAKGYLAKYAA